MMNGFNKFKLLNSHTCYGLRHTYETHNSYLSDNAVTDYEKCIAVLDSIDNTLNDMQRNQVEMKKSVSKIITDLSKAIDIHNNWYIGGNKGDYTDA